MLKIHVFVAVDIIIKDRLGPYEEKNINNHSLRFKHMGHEHHSMGRVNAPALYGRLFGVIEADSKKSDLLLYA